MTPIDMIYNAVFKGVCDKNISADRAKTAAVYAVEDYKKNRFKTPVRLIEEHIKLSGKKVKVKRVE